MDAANKWKDYANWENKYQGVVKAYLNSRGTKLALSQLCSYTFFLYPGIDFSYTDIRTRQGLVKDARPYIRRSVRYCAQCGSNVLAKF